MGLKSKLKLWYLFAQDRITVIAVIASFIAFFFLLTYCDEVKPNYEVYTQPSELVHVSYKYLYTHSGWNDAVPKVTGTQYQLIYRANGVKNESEVFVKHYSQEINRCIDEGRFDRLEIRFDLSNVYNAMVFMKE